MWRKSRHVDLDDIEDLLPANWPQIAKAAVDALDGLDAEARKAKIKTNPTWQALQDVLGDYLDGKCWYCESIIKRSPPSSRGSGRSSRPDRDAPASVARTKGLIVVWAWTKGTSWQIEKAAGS